jgi:hypothetical protein
MLVLLPLFACTEEKMKEIYDRKVNFVLTWWVLRILHEKLLSTYAWFASTGGAM